MKTFVLSFALLITLHVHCQWTTDTDVNTLVASSQSGDMQAVGTSDGKTYVVFWKSVSAPENYELRVQLLDENGVAQFGSEGMLLTDNIPMSTFTVIWSVTIDAEDNLYVGATGTQDTSAHVFKIDTEGNHHWGTDGVQIGTGHVVTILPLSNGEAIVSWYPSPNALMQRLDADGNTIWGSPKSVIGTGSNTVPAEMFELSGGDYIMVFHSILAGINSHLYAQRYNGNGDPQWGSALQLANRATAFNHKYDKVQDGDVAYMGYYASQGLRFDSYLQRINADGTLPWGINGADFDTNETDYEMETYIAFEAGSSYVWSVCKYSDSNQNNFGTYIQKFDKTTGARQFTNNAKQIYPLTNDPDVPVGELQLVNDQPLILFKRGFDSGVSPVTLHVAYLDENGDFAWAEETKPMATYEASKGRIQFTQAAQGQSVAVFIENKGSGDLIYAQNIVEQTTTIMDNTTQVSLFYANPITEFLKLECDTAIFKVEITDVNGKIIYHSTFLGEKSLTVATQNWAAGTYFLQIETSKGNVGGIKLVK